jgi:hypothetical protein
MTDSNSRNDIRALPAEVIEAIWLQTTFARVPEPYEYLLRGHRRHNPLLQAFVEIALGHPHYATVLDIEYGLNVPKWRAYSMVNLVIRKARRRRLTTGT